MTSTFTKHDGGFNAAQEPRKWLKKTLHLASVSLSLEALFMQKPAHELPVPLLHIAETEVR